MPHVMSWSEVSELPAAPGIAKRTIPGLGANLVMVTIAGGVSGAKHHHPHEQFVQVISGSGALETEEGERRFGPGDLFHFPAGTWHAATFLSDTVLIETNLAEQEPSGPPHDGG